MKIPEILNPLPGAALVTGKSEKGRMDTRRGFSFENKIPSQQAIFQAENCGFTGF